MKTAIAVLLICAICIAKADAAPKTAFVVNGLGETLSLINLEEGTVENNVVVLGLAPNWVCIRDGMVYVVNSLSDDIYIIDMETNLIVDSILLPEGSNPWAMEFLNDSIAYVTGFAVNSLFCINVKRREILETIPVGLSPQGLCIFQGKVFVAITAFDPNTWTYGDGMVYVIDAVSNSVIDSVSVGTNPQTLAVDPDGELYVVCTGDYGTVTGVVYKINSETHEVLDSLTTGGTPASISISGTGIAWVGAGGWDDTGYVYLIDTRTDSVIRGSTNPILVGRGAMGVAYDGAGNCYITSFAVDIVSVIDETGNIIKTYRVGDGPVAIAIYKPPHGIEEEENFQFPISNFQLKVYPNPFRERTVISLSMGARVHGCKGDSPLLPSSSAPLLKIYDLTGRLIRTLPITDYRAPITEVIWDGKDNQGRRLQGGVYFITVNGVTEKVVLVR